MSEVFTIVDLQKCFDGSVALNEMKRQIDLFIAMFVKPFSEKLCALDIWYARGQYVLTQYELLPGATLPEPVTEIHLCKSRGNKIGLAVLNPPNYGGFYQSSDIPRHMVKTALQCLPGFLNGLCELLPAIRDEYEFYLSVGND